MRDIDCAFKLFRRAVFRVIEIDAVGAMVNTEILVQGTRMGFRIKEVPVTHFPRLRGKQTGANLRVILKAFKELVRLYGKLRHISPMIIAHERRQAQHALAFADRRREERWRVLLPINFPDRRRRVLRLNGTDVPLAVTVEMSRMRREESV